MRLNSLLENSAYNTKYDSKEKSFGGFKSVDCSDNKDIKKP